MREGIEEKPYICSGHHYDYETGMCKLSKDNVIEGVKDLPCGKTPHCTFKVSDPPK